jgi:ankyrin repeat protein
VILQEHPRRFFWEKGSNHFDLIPEAVLLVQKGCPVKSPYALSDESALHHAASVGHLPVIKAILERDPSLIDMNGVCRTTPLQYAAACCEEAVSCTTFLLRFGSDIQTQKALGRSALEYLCSNRHHHRDRYPDYASGLIDCSPQHTSVLRHLIDLDIDFRGEWPLLGTIRSLQIALACVLIDAGADPSAADPLGMTALHVAVRESYPEAVEMLLLVAGNQIKFSACTNSGDTALNLAVKHATYYDDDPVFGEMIAYMVLGYSVPDTYPPSDDRFAYRHRSRKKSLDIIQLLCTHSHDMAAIPDDIGRTPFDIIKEKFPREPWDKFKKALRVVGKPLPPPGAPKSSERSRWNEE